MAGAEEITEADLIDLLRKLASGQGGRRTGELKRRGWLTWEVTKAGLATLSQVDSQAGG